MQSFPTPFSPDDVAVVNQLLESCARTRILLDKCKECGLAVDQLEQENERQAAVAHKVKAKFFPMEQ